MLLADRVAIITGAASARGIGKSAAARFADEGARVVIIDLDEDAAVVAAQDIGAAHRAYGCDVSDAPACQGVVDRVVVEFGHVDILLNSAGVSQPDTLMGVTAERYDLVMNVNLRGTFNMCRAVVPHFRSRQQGSIICIGSLAAQRGGGLFGGPHYAASKGGVHSLAKSMARELGPDGIRVNAIAPGMVDTDLFKGQISEEQKEAIAKTVPLGRLARPDDIAKACLFLASDLASYVTGVVLDVNGGMLIH
jgi:NAD(P)-dependent dehydrogenase (short-subunit alcohol dehydrogenase family)